jgi:hypothetical protein
MTYFKKIVALLATLAALTASLAVRAEESGAFVGRNNAQSEQSAKN